MSSTSKSHIANVNSAPLALGIRIRQIRLSAGLSQEELASKSELDRTYVGGIERGERNPSLKNIVRLAVSLKVPVETLFQDWEKSPKDKEHRE